MKHLIPALILAAAPLSVTSCGKTSVAAESAKSQASAPDPAAFVETYRKAMETKDTTTLDSFLLSDGSPAEVYDVDITLEVHDLKHLNEIMTSLRGKPSVSDVSRKTG